MEVIEFRSSGQEEAKSNGFQPLSKCKSSRSNKPDLKSNGSRLSKKCKSFSTDSQVQTVVCTNFSEDKVIPMTMECDLTNQLVYEEEGHT